MLLPALSKAREKARSISCVNQLRQLYTCAYMYTDSNDDTLPVVSITAGSPSGYTVEAYQSLSTPGTLWYGLVNTYVTNEKTFECPADTAKTNADVPQGSTHKDKIKVSYGMNAVSKTGAGASTSDNVAPNLTVDNPSATMLMGDVGKSVLAIYPYGGSTSAEDEYYLAYRHGDRFNVAFFDGHAEGFAKFTSLSYTKIKMSLTASDK